MRPLLCSLLVVAACSGAACGGALESDGEAPLALRSFGGSFAPGDAPWGGFGGASACTARRTPVVFLHGNGENAATWARPASDGGPSVLETFRRAGYQPCELFGLTWLSPAQQAWKQGNFHDARKAARVARFLDDVRGYTGQQQVDLVGHSLGVTVGLHAAEYARAWAGVRRFVSIAGALRGVQSCLAVGYANPAVPACGSQSLFDAATFGLYPLANPRLQAGGFRDLPARQGGTSFYSLRAGASDEILAPGYDSALFFDGPTAAQLDVGVGHPVEAGHDDSSGVGHLRARSDTGRIQVNMLSTACRGAQCCAGYRGVCGP